ncbi:MAG: hypothetical protein RBR86_01170 [Pseudobdellovibrionaceae bacterium]|jgi:hypothetical protein|nr:hypothetical protein [Pseudobdellovibrionaceae bacterium]
MAFIYTLALSLFLVGTTLATAQAEPFVYAPENCDMRVGFPEKPIIEKKCITHAEKQECTDVVTYKKIVPPHSSLTFRITCLEYPKVELNTYTPEIVEKTLNKLLKDQGLEPFDIQSETVDNMQRSTSMSIGTDDEGIAYMYSGQIWIGEKSLFTLEGNMKGPEEKSVEETFVSILRETYPKNMNPELEKKNNGTNEKKEDKKIPPQTP